MTLTKPKPARVPVNHHKRHGKHHQHSQHYLKSYWPYLPVLLVLGLGMFVNSWAARVHHDVLGYATNISSQMLLAETNGERTSNHAPALNLNKQLAAAAQAKANDMATRGYWSHVTPDGKQPWSFIETSGYQYKAAGENLAYGFGSSDQVMTAWMRSPEHRANLLNANYQDVGFAMANVANYQGSGPATIVVAMYGEPIGAIDIVPATQSVLGTQANTVTRLSLISTVSWAPIALGVICGAALMLFFVRHARAWHKVLVRSENFVMRHPYLDVALMSAVVVALILSNAAGTIL